MSAEKLEPGDVVQLDPACGPVFGGAFMLVTEPKVWGAQGYVQGLDKGRAYYRAKTEQMHFVGKAEWVPNDELSAEDLVAFQLDGAAS